MLDAVLSTQLEHDAWATRRLIDACRGLPPEAWRRRFPVGPGSLERTLAHLVDCAFFFGDAFAGTDYFERAAFESAEFEPDGLAVLHAEAADQLARAVTSRVGAGGTGAPVALPPGGDRLVPVPVALAQVFDHGSHHRAQAGWMLRELGLGPAVETHPLLFAGLDDEEDAN